MITGNRTNCKSLRCLGIGLFFEKDRVQEDGRTHQHGLLSHRSLFGEGDLEGVCIGKDFRFDALGHFQNLSQMRGFPTIGLGLVGCNQSL